MSFQVRDSEGIATAARRIAAEELAGAVEALRGAEDREGAVHGARKSVKKVRAVLRLVADDLGAERRRATDHAVRSAARRLSGARDATVQLATLKSLEAGEAATGLREILERRRAQLEREAADAPAVAAGELAAVLAGVGEWPLAEEGFAAAAGGVRRAYRDGRRAMRAALRGGDDEAWHDWRKRVKDLWYMARVLEPIAPASMGAVVAEADALADVLGLHNDLAVLGDTLTAHEAELDLLDVTELRLRLIRRRERHRAAAEPIGRRLYAERPTAFVRRVAAYWNARDLPGAGAG